jgi:hypothetical protein
MLHPASPICPRLRVATGAAVFGSVFERIGATTCIRIKNLNLSEILRNLVRLVEFKLWDFLPECQKWSLSTRKSRCAIGPNSSV